MTQRRNAVAAMAFGEILNEHCAVRATFSAHIGLEHETRPGHLDRRPGAVGRVHGSERRRPGIRPSRRLASLHERGALSDAEFATAKANLLGL